MVSIFILGFFCALFSVIGLICGFRGYAVEAGFLVTLAVLCAIVGLN